MWNFVVHWVSSGRGTNYAFAAIMTCNGVNYIATDMAVEYNLDAAATISSA